MLHQTQRRASTLQQMAPLNNKLLEEEAEVQQCVTKNSIHLQTWVRTENRFRRMKEIPMISFYHLHLASLVGRVMKYCKNLSQKLSRYSIKPSQIMKGTQILKSSTKFLIYKEERKFQSVRICCHQLHVLVLVVKEEPQLQERKIKMPFSDPILTMVFLQRISLTYQKRSWCNIKL